MAVPLPAQRTDQLRCWPRSGIQGPDWLGDPSTALLAIIILSIWQAVGFHMVIWLSGLQTIPGELYEAADIDGANSWQKFAHVTWPGLRQTRTFILITITIAAFAPVRPGQHHDRRAARSTPPRRWSSRPSAAASHQQQTGYAAAISLVFFVLVLIVTLIQRFLTRDKEPRR